MNRKFDLMIDADSIFYLLGFCKTIDTYKDETTYSGSQPYDTECNQKVFFNLSGSTMEPLELQFGKEITLNKCLKKSNAGVIFKQLNLTFSNTMGQCYDFVLPFRMCLRLTYVADK